MGYNFEVNPRDGKISNAVKVGKFGRLREYQPAQVRASGIVCGKSSPEAPKAETPYLEIVATFEDDRFTRSQTVMMRIDDVLPLLRQVATMPQWAREWLDKGCYLTDTDVRMLDALKTAYKV